MYRMVTDCDDKDLSLSGGADTPRALLMWLGLSHR